MATYTKFQQTIADVNNGVHNMSSDTLKFALTNSAPLVTNSIFANITEISAGNGYSAGGSTVAVTSSTQSSGTYSLVPTADVVITASGGSIGPFRYVVLYNDTPTSPADPLISFYDRGSSVTILDGDALTLDVQATLYTAT